MADKHIDQLREILAQAAARDHELQTALETLAADLLKEFGGDATSPVWAEIAAAKGERQVSPRFVMHDGWLRGDLVFEVAPDTRPVVSFYVNVTKDKTHQVVVTNERSQSVVIDSPDEKHREKARKELFERVFNHLEGQVRQSVGFTPLV